MALLTLPLVIVALVVLRTRFGWSVARLALLGTFYVYGLGVIGYTVLPLVGLEAAAEVRESGIRLRSHNFVPFRDLSVASRDFDGNLRLGVPFGLLAPGLLPPRWRAWRFVALCAGFGVAIEVTQGILGASGLAPGRTVDVTDMILNGVGALAGYACFAAVRALHGTVRTH